jgi:hypothetical protein
VADLRLLSTAVILVAALLSGGCATTYTRRVAGRVIDAKTGEPVVGADVMVYRKARRFREHGSLWVNFGHRWQETDESGHFDFPPVRDKKPYRVGGLLWTLKDDPTVRVTDERYGIEARDYREQGWEDLERDFFINMEISGPTELEAICEPDEEKRVREFCVGLYEPGASHCIEVVKGMRCHAQ